MNTKKTKKEIVDDAVENHLLMATAYKQEGEEMTAGVNAAFQAGYLAAMRLVGYDAEFIMECMEEAKDRIIAVLHSK